MRLAPVPFALRLSSSILGIQTGGCDPIWNHDNNEACVALIPVQTRQFKARERHGEGGTKGDQTYRFSYC